MSLKPPHVEAETSRIPEIELMRLFRVIPEGLENAKSSLELSSILSSNGSRISDRRVKEGIRQLRHDYKKPIGALPGKGFFLIISKEEIDLELAYLDRQIGDLSSTREIILKSFYKENENGKQSDFFGDKESE